MNYSDLRFDVYRKLIKSFRDLGHDWSEVYFATLDSEDKLKLYLETRYHSGAAYITVEEWNHLCALQQENEEQSIQFQDLGPTLITNGELDSEFTIKEAPSSSWSTYKRLLQSKDFSDDTIQNIEITSLRILKRLRIDTKQGHPVLGMVIGNVQSGKTANMAALMTMAADNGFNMFVILSGTIENLRKQTEGRLKKDLISEFSSDSWICIENESRKTLTDLYLSNTSSIRYFTVCLKNSSRLTLLLRMLKSDQAKKRQLKVLIFDDEADQAGINTADISKDERTKINKLIVELVYNRKKPNSEYFSPYESVNYIGYTATPYANILNESPDREDVLFPADFVAVLEPPAEYFGPQQIFGDHPSDSMPILNKITLYDDKILYDVQKMNLDAIPESLKDAIRWFFCCVSCFRLWNINKPVSMLVHTSQNTSHHDNVEKAIRSFLSNTDTNTFLIQCEKTWETQTKQFTLEDLYSHIPGYFGVNIHKYPKFEDIQSEIISLKDFSIQRIEMKDDGELNYSKGIHLCIDNCKYNPGRNDKVHIRLAYPDESLNLDFCTAFIVVGGATLSRGLTIEGLVSTYFPRHTSQADTLMQMGRWFGYRRHYELLPRIWITDRIKKQFEFLTSLDFSLRHEMSLMDSSNVTPRSCGIKVKNSPKNALLRITAKKRMQDAEFTEFDFSGAVSQTTAFFEESKKIANNLEKTQEFIKYLNIKFVHETKNVSYIWREVDYEHVFEYIKSLFLPNMSSEFVEIDRLEDWYKKVSKKGIIEKWNIIIPGVNAPKERIVDNISIRPVNRSRKKQTQNDGIIRIGALRSLNDLALDIDDSSISNEERRILKNPKTAELFRIRNKSGLSSTPALLIYFIDKDSVPVKGSEFRIPLNSADDLIGICINIPGGRTGESYAESLVVRIKDRIKALEETDDVQD
ncbi:MAG: Z1 domain-containing protein [Firmicutes bacterium]|nr:Z1 domain-containing protein [Bacillota bacterium]